jgi:hypothetical protein
MERLKEVILEGNLIEKGEELKNIFRKYPGDGIVILKVEDTYMTPEDVDNETGEVLQTKVSLSQDFLNEVKELGITVLSN